MASKLDDRWLWLGLGAFLFVAAKGISLGLQDIVRLNEIHDPSYGNTTYSPRIEDSISPSALRTLTQSPNPDITHSAISLLLSRFALSPSEQSAWADDLFSSSATTRLQAKKLDDLIYTHGLANDIPTPEILRFRGLIRRSIDNESRGAETLRAAFHAAKRRKDSGHDDAWNALRRVSLLLERDDRENIKILVVRRGTLSTTQVLYWAIAQKRLLEVPAARIASLGNDAIFQLAVKGMATAKNEGEEETELDGEVAKALEDDESDTEDNVMFTPVINGAWDAAGGRTARFHEESPEETEVRRRRREAMVLHEGGGAISREDILQPRRRS